MTSVPPGSPSYRDARLEDIPAMMTIRNGVRENALVQLVLTAADYEQAMTTQGRAWVCEVDGAVVGFACGRPDPGDIWALFVAEAYEGRGIGSALMDRVETWMFATGLDEVWLVTGAGTRAERLYQHRGWVLRGHTASAEAKYVLTPADREVAGTTSGTADSATDATANNPDR